MRALIVSNWRGSCDQALPAFWAVDMRAGAEEYLGGFHYRLRKRGMRVKGHGDIAGKRRHFDREHAFGNQLTRSRADDADAEHPFALQDR